MAVAWIGLGGNLGDAAATLRAAIAALGELPDTSLAGASLLYSTPAWGNLQQPPFVNAVAALHTTLPPLPLLQALLGLELQFGRVRDPAVHWGPRALDLDLLLYDAQEIELPGLSVPHPYLHERAFVLVPMAELAARIAPQLAIPGHGRVQDAVVRVDACGISRLEG